MIKLSSLLHEILKEEDSEYDAREQEWLTDELIPFLVALPDAQSVSNAQILKQRFIQKLKTHPIGSQLDDAGRSEIAMEALIQLGKIDKDDEPLPF